MRRNKTANDTWELIEEEGELKNMLGFLVKHYKETNKRFKKQSYKNM